MSARKGSNLCRLVHRNPERSASQDIVQRQGRLGLSASSILDFIKPRCSLWETKKRASAVPYHQPEKIRPILKSMNKLTLEDWIMNSPSLNIQFSERIHPFYKYQEIVDVKSSEILQPVDSLCAEVVNYKLKADHDDGDNKQAAVDSSRTRQNGKREKKVRFRLPEVADIFLMDSVDGYYYSK